MAAVDQALLEFFSSEIGRAYRALERHRPDRQSKCRGCSTQLALASWPCRIFRVAAVACDSTCDVTDRHAPAETPVSMALRATHDRPFLAAIEANATARTVPMRAVPRTPSTAPGISAGRVPTHGKKN